MGIQKDECPIGTVPIKRTTKDDLIRGKSYFNNGLSDHIHGNHVSFCLYLPVFIIVLTIEYLYENIVFVVCRSHIWILSIL